jgi:DNA-binding helix-hairpin-helix protein with protein kinase domain
MLFALGVIAFFGILKALDKSKEIQGYKTNLEAATTRWKQAEADWQTKAGPQAFEAKKAKLSELRQAWNNIPNVRLRKLEELKKNQYNLQLERFLDAFQIEKARIEGIGSGRKQTLESYGIETAADVARHKLRGIPGFGPKLQAALLNWRSALESRFVFDPSRAIDPRDTAKIEQEVLAEKTLIEGQLRAGVAELKQVHAQIQAVRQHMRAQVEGVYRDYLQAVADNTAVS